MQFDRTRIAIRERPFMDVVDLSFQVLRAFWRPLVLGMLLTALPFALLNGWLLNGLIFEELEPDTVSRYVWLMTMIVFLQAPLVSAIGTAYLGNALFYRPAGAGDLWRDARGALPRLLVVQGIYRGAFLGIIALSMIDPMGNHFWSEFFFLPLICAVAIGVRATRPFVNEITLLEKCPLRSGKNKRMTISNRSSALHRYSSSDLLGRWIFSALLAIFLVISLFGSFYFLASLFLGGSSYGYGMWSIGLPLAMWMTALLFTVVRFMGYLDLRIRREGWEVELLIRTAGAHLAEQVP